MTYGLLQFAIRYFPKVSFFVIKLAWIKEISFNLFFVIANIYFNKDVYLLCTGFYSYYAFSFLLSNCWRKK